MNNLLSYCGLIDAKIRASDKDLPVYQLLYWIYSKEKQTVNEVQTQQEQPKVKEQGAKKKHGNEDLESKKKAPKKAKKEPTTQPCMPDLIKSTQQAKEVCCIL